MGGRDHTTVLNSIRKHEIALANGETQVKRPREIINVMTKVSDEDVRRIVEAVAARHGLTTPQIIGRQKSARIVVARDEAMYQCGTLTGLTQAAIGRMFGDRVHSAVSLAMTRHQVRQMALEAAE